MTDKFQEWCLNIICIITCSYLRSRTPLRQHTSSHWSEHFCMPLSLGLCRSSTVIAYRSYTVNKLAPLMLIWFWELGRNHTVINKENREDVQGLQIFFLLKIASQIMHCGQVHCPDRSIFHQFWEIIDNMITKICF